MSRPISCIIVDDDETSRFILTNLVKKNESLKLLKACSNAIEARQTIEENEVELMLLDIEMPYENGVDMLAKLEVKPDVIFITSQTKHAIKAFELNAVDSLLKPITFPRFFNAIEKFKDLKHKVENGVNPIALNNKNDHIFVSKNRKKIKLIFDEILYIESLKDYIKIHLTNESQTIKFSISAFEKELDQRFVRIHRSYIVNQNKITAFTKNDVEIGDLQKGQIIEFEMQKTDSGQYEIIDYKADDSVVATDVWLTGDISMLMADFGMITLNHMPVAEWNWDAGEMNFTVGDEVSLSGFKEGQKVRFLIEKQGTDYVLKQLEAIEG